MGLSTPLIYAGGIRTVAEGVAVIKAGADRICIDAALHEDPGLAAGLAEPLGAQAVIAALPLARDDGRLTWLDHRNRSEKPLADRLLALLESGAVSETLLIDWRNEGRPGGFDEGLVEALPAAKTPLIVFGGLSEAAQMAAALGHPRIAAVAVGNFLSYREHAVQAFKSQLPGVALRPPAYDSRNLLSQ
jgi:cyclase